MSGQEGLLASSAFIVSEATARGSRLRTRVSFRVLLSREFSRLLPNGELALRLVQDDHWSGQTFGLLVILTRYVNKRPLKNLCILLRFERTSNFFSLYVLPYLLCYTFNFISCSLFLASDFDRSEERLDRAKNNLAGQRNR